MGSVFKNRKVIQQTMSYLAIKQCFFFKQPRSGPTRLKMVCVDDTCPWHLTALVVKDSECIKITLYVTIHTCDIDTWKNYNKHANYKLLGEVVKIRFYAKGSESMLTINMFFFLLLRVQHHCLVYHVNKYYCQHQYFTISKIRP